MLSKLSNSSAGTAQSLLLHCAASVFAQTLPDGRMKVGVDLPLLSRRFRYLRLLGEGVSAQVWFRLGQSSAIVVPIKAYRFITWLLTLQVILAEDTYSQNSKVVVIKVLKRHLSNVGQKVTL